MTNLENTQELRKYIAKAQVLPELQIDWAGAKYDMHCDEPSFDEETATVRLGVKR